MFIIHARKLHSLALAKENREIPPLDYPRVYQLKRDFPHPDHVDQRWYQVARRGQNTSGAYGWRDGRSRGISESGILGTVDRGSSAMKRRH